MGKVQRKTESKKQRKTQDVLPVKEQKKKGSSQIAGAYYIESMVHLIPSKKVTADKHEEMQSFVQMILNPDDEHSGLGSSFNQFMSSQSKKAASGTYKQLIKILEKITEKDHALTHDVVMAYETLLDRGVSQVKVLHRIAHSLGKIGHKYEKESSQVIRCLSKIADPNHDLSVLREVTHALYDIGLSWKKKKSIFNPLINMITHPDPNLKIEIIHAIRTQLEGYWEKPISVLKDIALYDDVCRVRCSAVIALGDTGEYTSFSVRESIYELIDDVGKQVFNLKKEMLSQEKKGQDVSHIRARLMDVKEVMKVLYHYSRIYKYRATR